MQPRFSQKVYQVSTENIEKNGKKDEYEQSFGYWQHPNDSQDNPEDSNETFYSSGKTQNQNEQFTVVNFVFRTRNNTAQYTYSICSTKFDLKPNFFSHFKNQC